MQDDSGGVDDGPQGRPLQVRQRPLDARRDGRFSSIARQNVLACGIHGAADFGDDEGARESCQSGRKLFEHLMNSEKFAEFLGIAHEFDGTCLCQGGATV